MGKDVFDLCPYCPPEMLTSAVENKGNEDSPDKVDECNKPHKHIIFVHCQSKGTDKKEDHYRRNTCHDDEGGS